MRCQQFNVWPEVVLLSEINHKKNKAMTTIQKIKEKTELTLFASVPMFVVYVVITSIV
jgi:hypothetical protein